MGEKQRPIEHVAKFVGEFFLLFKKGSIKLRPVFPLHELENLANLEGERECHVLRVVELLPITRLAKSDNRFGEASKFAFGHGFGHLILV